MRMFKHGGEALAVLLLSMDCAPHVNAGGCQRFLVPYPFADGYNGKMRHDGFSIAKKDSCRVLLYVDDDGLTPMLQPCSFIAHKDSYLCWIVQVTHELEGFIPARAKNRLAEDKSIQVLHYCSQGWEPTGSANFPQNEEMRAGVKAYGESVKSKTHQLSEKDLNRLKNTKGPREPPYVQCAYTSSNKKNDLWWHVACHYLDCSTTEQGDPADED
ncbi:hypothetical protein BCR37DRAFT_379253 [Protomyces lactucae-debilis]|uniref:Uncharacterized protein n=1 Tax=Protomyces lactucae-debilis TaxID=2754530 RepID=A0A1Y2FH17_PROLT|nr:uncharacterized protein BCR37DRAFT_379253 [Protomyces lactucae-debilis]ORY83241.1 hypothetical protein BCR37DRAFT_379253 [Protomyces lactucae-debilis]